MKNRKILFVIDSLGTGGAQRQMIQLAVGLKRRGYEGAFFCYAKGDLLAAPLHSENIPILWNLKSSRYSPGVVYRLQRQISDYGCSVVISFLTTPNFYAILSTHFQFRRVPVIVSERFCDLPGRVSTLERMVRRFYRFSSHVVFNSHHQRRNFVEHYPWLKDRISTIFNGYDLETYRPCNQPTNNPTLRMLTVASISPYKNGMMLIEALEILKKEYGLKPEVSWIGRRFTEGEYAEYVRCMDEKIALYGLGEQWHWLGERTDIPDQMHRHDVLVHPSYGEGLPNVVCEALCCGRPVLLSNTLDHPILVRDNYNGFLFHWSDPLDLAEKIKRFADLPPEQRESFGHRGRSFAETHLGLDRYIDDFEKLIRKVTA